MANLVRSGFVTTAEAAELARQAFSRMGGVVPLTGELAPHWKPGAIVRRQGSTGRYRIEQVERLQGPGGPEMVATVRKLDAWPVQREEWPVGDLVLVTDADLAERETRERMNRVDPRVAVVSTEGQDRMVERLANATAMDVETVRARLEEVTREAQADLSRMFVHGGPEAPAAQLRRPETRRVQEVERDHLREAPPAKRRRINLKLKD